MIKGYKMINLPIFRAKRLYSDEYVFGVPRQDSKGMYEMIIDVVEDGIAGVIQRYIEVDTISIHFPDMLDSQGNKIFASLQEDGKGGDIMQDDEYFGIAKYKDCQFVVEYEDCIDNIDNGNFEVIGIQQ